jgi:hypothetical protein
MEGNIFLEGLVLSPLMYLNQQQFSARSFRAGADATVFLAKEKRDRNKIETESEGAISRKR